MISHSEMNVLDLTRRLVDTPSENPGDGERAVAGEVARVAAELGLPAPRVLGDPDRPNLLITLNSGTPGPHVGLCGHLDTKPVGAGEWATEPLVATVVGEEVRGRGVVDMKGAIAAMLLAAADISAAGLPAGRLSLVLCADEENGAVHGAELLTREHGALDLDCLVIGEPGGIHTDWDRLHLGSRGICNVDIEVTTEQAHSGLTDALGWVSATQVAARLLVDIVDDFVPPVPAGSPWTATMNGGVFLEGGVSYGVVPGWARVGSDCRLAPGMDRAAFELALTDFVRHRTPDGATTDITVLNWIKPVVLDASHELVQAARAAQAAVVGHEPELDLFPATTDASWFDAVGVPCLPAFGPGLLRHAHARDEAVSLAALEIARPLYVDLVGRLLRTGPRR